MDRIARHVLVSGRVQGVAFRHHTKLEARALGLGGWVRNRDDGRVEVWLEGGREPVEALAAWLAHGPPSARVEHVEIADVAAVGHTAFVVRFD